MNQQFEVNFLFGVLYLLVPAGCFFIGAATNLLLGLGIFIVVAGVMTFATFVLNELWSAQG